MARFLAAVRPGERRDTAAAFTTLFGFIASFSMLETARDALFLARVPVARLPWMYLAIAAFSFAVVRASDPLSRWVSGKRAMSAWLLVVSAVTLGLWWTLDRARSGGVYVLYVWSGVVSSLVSINFWTLVGEAFSITQAKRLYGVIGAGSVLGAIIGTGAASLLSDSVRPRNLLLISAAAFAVTALVPSLFRSDLSHRPDTQQPGASSPVFDDARYVAQKPYVRSVALLLVTAACALTLADFVFKSAVAAAVPQYHLVSYLARVYFVLNLLSLAAQLAVVGWLIRRFNVALALAILPGLLLVGGLGVLVSGGLLAALLVKGADGTLRYSLHRTASELLFVPLAEEVRRRVKGFVDVVGQRVGQALASIGILVAVAFGVHLESLGAALVVLAGVWIGGALGIRRHYLDLFRKNLHTGHAPSHFPELDVASLETLVATLDSSNDDEVLAALGVIEREGRARIVPALILHHPSERVVERALELFARAGRANVVPVLDRLLEHPSPRVRAAAIACRSVLAPDARLLNFRLSLEESPEVRATIVINLIAAGEIVGAEADERVASLLAHGSVETRIALAGAVALRDKSPLRRILLPLSRAPESEVKLAAVSAMTRLKSPEFLPALLELAVHERTRTAARNAIAAQGEAGFECVAGALRDVSLPQAVRRELPRLLQSFDPQRAASALVDQLPLEPDGMVRYRTIRALEWLVAREPRLTLDVTKLGHAIDETVSRAYRYLDRRLSLEAGARSDPRRKTPGHELLVKMLHDKEENAVGRLLRLLGLVFPSESFEEIRRGLQSGQRKERASSIELIENLLEPPLRGAVIGLVDDLPDAERLQAAGRYHARGDLDYEALLEQMLASKSDGLRDLTVYHVGELRLVRFRSLVERLPRGSHTETGRTLEILDAALAV